jgi:hypothetical protein
LRGDVLHALGLTLLFFGLGAVIIAGALTIAVLNSDEPSTESADLSADAPETLVDSDS